MKATIEKLQGNWNEAKGKLKQKYGQLTDDDLTYIEGKEEELIGQIQKKTGEARASIIKYLEQL